MNRTRVVVYDSSLYMAGIAASLRTDPTLDVVSVHPRSGEAWQHLNELQPAVIAFEMSQVPVGLGIRLLHDHPYLLLIGVDQSSAEMLVLSCQQQQALAVADLLKVIHQTELQVEGTEKNES